MAEEAAYCLLKELPQESLPTGSIDVTQETKDIGVAYKNGLTTVNSLPGGRVCDLLGVSPIQGVSSAMSDLRIKKYTKNELCPLQHDILGVPAWADARYHHPVLVLRDGHFIPLNPIRVVVGDIVYLKTGDDVPADMRILKTTETQSGEYKINRQGDWTSEKVVTPTVIDATLPCGHQPFIATHAVSKQAFEKANNIAFRGATVFKGALIGVVFATGLQCFIAKLKLSPIKHAPAPKLPKGADKKKTAKVSQKVEGLGFKPKHNESFGALCGVRNMTVVVRVTKDIIKDINKFIIKIVAQNFRLILLFCGDVTSDQIRQLPNRAIGKPIDMTRVLNFDDAVQRSEFISMADSESLLLAYCTASSIKDVIIAAEDKFAQPVVFFSDHVEDGTALARATLGVCRYTAPVSALQSCQAYMGPSALDRLSLYLKVLKESSEVFG